MGIAPEQLQDTLDMVNDEFEAKAENIAMLIREIVLDAEGYKAEIDLNFSIQLVAVFCIYNVG